MDMRSYEGIVQTWGHQVVADCRFGDYQGDHAFFLKGKDGSYGWLVVGYGSCSGCDSLEAAWGYEYDYEADAPAEVIKLAEEMRTSVLWKPKGEMVEYLTTLAKGEPIKFYSADDEVTEFMLAMVTVMTGVVPT